MDLYIIRHAIAEERRPGLADQDRQLTQRGRARFARVVQALTQLEIRFDYVHHSPWRRAAQTAAMLLPLASEGCHATAMLADSPNVAQLGQLPGVRAAWVGHEPWLSEVVGILLTGHATAHWLHLKKGSVLWLDGDVQAGEMMLRGYWSPKMLRGLL